MQFPWCTLKYSKLLKLDFLYVKYKDSLEKDNKTQYTLSEVKAVRE